jgi:DNA-binding PadR family transcriptional regulator
VYWWRGDPTQNTNPNGLSRAEAVRKIEAQIVKKHLDLIILKALEKGPLGGYALISLVHREYGVLLGAGMVYNLLRSLEKRRLIKVNGSHKARYYVLNGKGEEILNVVANNRNRIRNVTNRIF